MTAYRIATRSDETDVLAVLEEVAPEVPVSLEGAESQGKIQTLIRQGHASGKSWVAVDESDKVVGFALARPDAHEGKAAVYLNYVGVSAASRKQGVFAGLMQKLKAGGVAITADVLNGNKSTMVDRLTKIGFTQISADDQQTKLAWSPPKKNESV